MDPFVEFRYGTSGTRSVVKKNGGRETSFDESIGPLPLTVGEELRMSVKDFDRHKGHETIGDAQPFVFDELPKDENGSWEGALNLSHEGQERGQLFIKVQFMP